jgi:hypothetical protein
MTYFFPVKLFRKWLWADRWEWLLRAYAAGVAIATVRPVMALSFVFFGLRPQTFPGTAFWIGFSLHAIVAEIWINLDRAQADNLIRHNSPSR